MIRRISVYVLWVAVVVAAGCGGPSSPVSHPELSTVGDGEAMIEAGDVEGALAVFKEIVAYDAENPTARFYLGFCLYNTGDPKGAAAQYETAISLDGSLVEARLNLGSVLLETGDAEGAVTQFLAVAEADPEAADAHVNLAYAYEAAGKKEEAMASLDKAAMLDPSDPDPLLAIGTMALDAGDVAKAEEYYLKAQRVAPGDAVVAFNLALIYIGRDKLDEAVAQLTSIADMDAEGILYVQGAMELKKLEKTDEAMALYQKAVSVDPPYVEAHISLGNLLARSGDFAKAATHFEKFIELAPDHPKAQAAKKGLAACNAKLSQ